MNRLQSQLRRLYLLSAPLTGDADAAAPSADASGRVRALVIELARPADWDVLSLVWRGVQADLELPAPAIAVSGTDGLQLWFSLDQAVSTARAAEFLVALRARYLPAVASARVRCWPSLGEPGEPAALVPAQQADTENWSAFVAPDLAPVFADTPWLDIPPSLDGQADLLSRLQSIKPEAFDAAMARLSSTAEAPTPPVRMASSASAPASPNGAAPDVDPRRFLQQVLNDETMPLVLRVDAAKALLPHADVARDGKGAE